MTIPGCLGCGPGARTFWAKSIGRAGPLPGGFGRLPQDAAGRSGDRLVAPTRRKPLHRRFKRLARLVHEMEAASWFLHRRSLPPGLAPDRRPSLSGPISIRFARFTVFHTSGSAGGHDWSGNQSIEKNAGKVCGYFGSGSGLSVFDFAGKRECFGHKKATVPQPKQGQSHSNSSDSSAG